MPDKLSIAVVGDFNPTSETHRATNEGVRHAAEQLGIAATARWVPTTSLDQDAEGELSADSGIWIAPGSPYKSMVGALAAIRIARERRIPLLGTCGGFQHVVIEYATQRPRFRRCAARGVRPVRLQPLCHSALLLAGWTDHAD